MKKRRDYDGLSLRNRRPTNMDSLLIKEREIDGRRTCLAVVCDGVGSLEQGALAASVAVQRLGEWFDRLEDLARMGLRLRDTVLKINGEILSEAQRQGVRTATTLSALLLEGERYYIVHAGDSRIYSFGRDGLRQLTRDDVTEEGKLVQCIGRTQQPALFYNEGEQEGQVFLLCSDGLYKRMDLEYLASRLGQWDRRELRKILEELTEFVVERGETDNISAAIVKSRG